MDLFTLAMVNVIGTYLHTYYNQQYLDTACNSASNATPFSKDSSNNYLREEGFGKSDINTNGQVLNIIRSSDTWKCQKQVTNIFTSELRATPFEKFYRFS